MSDDYAELPEDDGVLEPSDSLDTDVLDTDPLDAGIVPPDRWSVAESFGTTAREAHDGASLDQLLAAEDPEVQGPVSDAWQDGPGPRAGRLVASDEGAHGTAEPETYAYDEGVDGGAASAEEAAVHIERDWGEEGIQGAEGAAGKDGESERAEGFEGLDEYADSGEFTGQDGAGA